MWPLVGPREVSRPQPTNPPKPRPTKRPTFHTLTLKTVSTMPIFTAGRNLGRSTYGIPHIEVIDDDSFGTFVNAQ